MSCEDWDSRNPFGVCAGCHNGLRDGLGNDVSIEQPEGFDKAAVPADRTLVTVSSAVIQDRP